VPITPEEEASLKRAGDFARGLVTGNLVSGAPVEAMRQAMAFAAPPAAIMEAVRAMTTINTSAVTTIADLGRVNEAAAGVLARMEGFHQQVAAAPFLQRQEAFAKQISTIAAGAAQFEETQTYLRRFAEAVAASRQISVGASALIAARSDVMAVAEQVDLGPLARLVLIEPEPEIATRDDTEQSQRVERDIGWGDPRLILVLTVLLVLGEQEPIIASIKLDAERAARLVAALWNYLTILLAHIH
jgi:hypothetical protein